MKITNASIKPVEEELGDPQNFVRVIPFLDHPKILHEIYKLRQKLQLVKPKSPEEYQGWFDQKTNMAASKDETSRVWNVYMRDCVKVLETYGRQDVHYYTLWIAVVCNKIRDIDCISTYIEIVYPDLKPGLLPKLALIFTPNSTEKEIIKIFKTEKDSAIQKYLLYEVGKGTKIRDFLRGNVSTKQLREQRQLYWKYKPHKFGYLKVAQTLSKKDETRTTLEYLEYVRSRVNSYKRRVDESVRLLHP